MTQIRFFNTLGRNKQVFAPISSPNVGLYCCGPTVYDYAHIGNFRTYIFEDILRRVLQYNDFKVKHIINITDVGHLTSDADEGEDKLVKAIKREGLPLTHESMLVIAKKYEQAFKDDFKMFNCLEPFAWPHATEYIQQMIDIVKLLEEKGFTYKTSTAIMFDISKYEDYSNLACLNLEGQKEGARSDVIKDSEKRNPQDFALWFFGKKTHIMQWDSPWGKGFPGWHIECSAMSRALLGDQFDIHCGGIDHIPVHHTNEIAQSECALSLKPWVNYWLHGEHLTVKDSKMSKSAGTFITLQKLIDEGFDPLDFRYFCLNAHYRSHLNFDINSLKNARNAFQSLKERILDFKENIVSNQSDNDYKQQFLEAINDDLNMPVALSILWAVVKDNDLGNKQKLDLIFEFDKVFGLSLSEVERVELSEDLMKLIKEREDARKNKDWARSDELRGLLKDKGILIEDTGDGTKWKRVF